MEGVLQSAMNNTLRYITLFIFLISSSCIISYNKSKNALFSDEENMYVRIPLIEYMSKNGKLTRKGKVLLKEVISILSDSELRGLKYEVASYAPAIEHSFFEITDATNRFLARFINLEERTAIFSAEFMHRTVAESKSQDGRPPPFPNMKKLNIREIPSEDGVFLNYIEFEIVDKEIFIDLKKEMKVLWSPEQLKLLYD